MRALMVDWWFLLRTSRTWRFLRWLPVLWLAWLLVSHPSARLWGEEVIVSGRPVQPAGQKITHAVRYVNTIDATGQPVQCVERCEIGELALSCLQIRCYPLTSPSEIQEPVSPPTIESPVLMVPRPLVSCLVEKFKDQPGNLGYQLFLWSSELLAGRGFVVDCGVERYEVRVE